jgi:hypothetical protein
MANELEPTSSISSVAPSAQIVPMLHGRHTVLPLMEEELLAAHGKQFV